MITATTRRARLVEEFLKINNGIFTGAGVGLAVRRGQITVPDLIRTAFQILLWIWVVLAFLSVIRILAGS
jgi:hypothetical protein